MMLQEKLALVTGASRGIGKAIALQLGKMGAQVIGTATSDKGAAEITTYLSAHNIVGKGLTLDVRDNNSVAEALSEIEQEFGSVLILVNNAGVTRDNLMLRMKEGEWLEVIDTNLNSLYRITKPLLRGMTKARFGRIINIGSVVGAMGNAGQVNYVSSKAGLEGFTKALAREVGSRGITVNAVAPGFIATDMTDKLSEQQRSLMLSQIPLARLGETSDIAKAVSFLASDDASYITGTTLAVNGGMLM